MNSIAFINQKGGVGKTTSTINIGAGLSRMGKKVLLIDFDPQANLTHAFGIDPETLQKTCYELVKSISMGVPVCAQDYLIQVDIGEKHKLHLLPSSIGLSGLEKDTRDHAQRDFLFKETIKQFEQFDYILVDCPPSLDILTINVLSAVQEVYIPVQTEFFALQGLGQISNVVTIVNQALNPALKLGGVIGTKFNNRKLHKDVMTYLKDKFADLVFKTVIRDNIALAEAPSFGKDIYSYSPKSNGAKDYNLLCKEIINAHKREVVS
jgi:chromosome partitioning protein